MGGDEPSMLAAKAIDRIGDVFRVGVGILEMAGFWKDVDHDGLAPLAAGREPRLGSNLASPVSRSTS